MRHHAEVITPSDLPGRVGAMPALREAEPCHGELMKGRLGSVTLRSGLSLHWSDCVELHHFTTEIDAPPQLSFVLFLEGDSTVSYDGRRYQLGVRRDRAARGGGPQGFTVGMFKPMTFMRRARRNNRIRKLSVSLCPEWFEQGGYDQSEGLRRLIDFDKQSFCLHAWSPSARLLALAEQCLAPADDNVLLRNLYLESRALDIVQEGLRLLQGNSGRQPCAGLLPHEHRRVRRTVALLDSNQADGWSLERIAHEVGTNPTTLQRQFRAVHGMTLFKYLRRRKLTEARQALERQGATVAQAAWIAGYTSAANFSTAFKREFGLTPQQARIRS